MTKIPKKKRWIEATGSIGKWTAEVRWDDGTKEELPVAHQTLCLKGSYHDPHWVTTGPMRPGDQTKMDAWVTLAKAKGRVVIQRGTSAADFKRSGYAAVFDISGINVDPQNGLTFKFDWRYERML